MWFCGGSVEILCWEIVGPLCIAAAIKGTYMNITDCFYCLRPLYIAALQVISSIFRQHIVVQPNCEFHDGSVAFQVVNSRV